MTSPIPDQRGGSYGLTAIGMAFVTVLVAGLVVDTSRQYSAASNAQSAAAAAARAGADASATQRLAGSPVDAASVSSAAQAYLASANVAGTVSVQGTTIHVTTTATVPTEFLSVIGINQVRGRGDATAELITP
ncbi:pilus assembly protein TadG-related protein [Luteococcus sp.]|uniref:pilus assembly protein TadG-related protein n=1 Tax=Luteococcus sp. TaxID=1969402 RepID=UPI003736DE36